jgi:hypothetical protein
MKLLMIIGALLGFAIGVGCGIAKESSWSSILWRASVAAYLSGMLFRWWGRTWIRGLKQAQSEKLAAAVAAQNLKPSPNRGKT